MSVDLFVGDPGGRGILVVILVVAMVVGGAGWLGWWCWRVVVVGSVRVWCWLVVVCSKNGAARSCCGAGVYSCLLLYSRWLVGCGGLWCWAVVGWIVYVVGGDREQTFSALLLCSRSGYLNLEKCKYI